MSLQPARPSRKTRTGVVSNTIQAITVDTLVGDALVDVGRAHVILESVRTLTLEHFTRILKTKLKKN